MSFWQRFAFIYQLVALCLGALAWIVATDIALTLIIGRLFFSRSNQGQLSSPSFLLDLVLYSMLTLIILVCLTVLYFAVYWRFDNRRVPIHDAIGVCCYIILITPGSLLAIPSLGIVLVAVVIAAAFLNALAAQAD